MKKSFAVLALVLVCAMLVPCFASAVSFTAQADAMKDMGLFLGTNNGYDLDKAPTRAQAAVMLVRFLGKEAEAKAGEWETPFTDVPDWAKPYVGYLYENDLTKGMSDTTYVPDDTCSAQMYVTFILRALGYMDEEGKDTFAYAEALTFGEEKGLVTEENCDTENFLRDHMVGIAYTALALPTADAAYDALVKKLVADGAVTEEQAAKVLDGSYIPEEGGEEEEEEGPVAIDVVCDVAVHNIATYGNYPVDADGNILDNGIADAWDNRESRYDFKRGIVITIASNQDLLEAAVAASGDGEQIAAAIPDLYLASDADVYIYNGKPGDDDYGTKVAGLLAEVVPGARLAFNAAGSHVWLASFWRLPADRTLADDYYTIVVVPAEGDSVAFTTGLGQCTLSESHYNEY